MDTKRKSFVTSLAMALIVAGLLVASLAGSVAAATGAEEAFDWLAASSGMLIVGGAVVLAIGYFNVFESPKIKKIAMPVGSLMMIGAVVGMAFAAGLFSFGGDGTPNPDEIVTETGVFSITKTWNDTTDVTGPAAGTTFTWNVGAVNTTGANVNGTDEQTVNITIQRNDQGVNDASVKIYVSNVLEYNGNTVAYDGPTLRQYGDGTFYATYTPDGGAATTNPDGVTIRFTRDTGDTNAYCTIALDLNELVLDALAGDGLTMDGGYLGFDIVIESYAGATLASTETVHVSVLVESAYA